MPAGRSTRSSRAATADSQTSRAETLPPADDEGGFEGEGMEKVTISQASDEAGPSQSTRRQQSGSDHRQSQRRSEDQEEDDRDRSARHGGRRFHPGPSPFEPRNEANHVKIMLATDNHVGFMERDPIRGQDSINTFREILQLAVAHDVDAILLGGDLFHDNKPSRATLHQVMASLRQHCLSDKPISLELLSDPNDGRAEGYDFPAINYEDPNFNIGIPVFSIHGNHDDPQGIGVEGALSALDVLSVSGLVNYFGKVELPSNDDAASKANKRAPDAGGLSDVGIRIRPILLAKGDTKLALYGMGNIRDERMHYELRANRVRMYRPRETPDDWFNILCVHQNRAAHNPKACVPETMFDDSIHLVVWGHEHEQLIQPQAVGGKNYHISQPGSSVATSLSAGEAAEKAVAIIHIEETDYYLESLPLQTVRPFIMDDMSLKEEAEDAHVDVKDKGAVQQLLRSRVTELIDKANEEWDEKWADTPEQDRPARMLPLVRLRVEYEASLELGNPIRFGQEFVDKVANPRDVLHFSKKKVSNAAAKRARGAKDPRYAFVDVDIDDVVDADKFEKIKVGGLVKEFLERQNLELLNSDGLERAITNFVEKDDRDAIIHFVAGMMKSYQGQLNSMVPSEKELDKELDRIRDEQHRNRRNGESEAPEDQMEASTSRAGTKGAAISRGQASKATRAATSSRRRADSDDSMLDDDDGGAEANVFDDDDDDEEEEEEQRRQQRAGSRQVNSKGPASRSAKATSSRSNGTQRKATSKSRQNTTFLGNSDEDQSMDDDDDDDRTSMQPPAPTPRTSRADVLARGTPGAKGKKAASSKTQGSRAAAAPPSASRTSSRAAASKAQSRLTFQNRRNEDSDEGDVGRGRGRSGSSGRDDSPGFEIDEEASQPLSQLPRGAARRR